MSKKQNEWVMPDWMKSLERHFVNTGGNDVSEMMNGNANPRTNLYLSTLQACVKSEVRLLEVLHSNPGTGIHIDPAVKELVDAARSMYVSISCLAESRDDVNSYDIPWLENKELGEVLKKFEE